MRISDWSSDVCSSDLHQGAARRLHAGSAERQYVGAPAHRPRRIAIARARRGDARTGRDAAARAGPHRRARPDDADRLVAIAPAARRLGTGRAVDGVAIGRASCRERVCQYVEVSVVALTLQKKHIHVTYTPKQTT